MNRHQREDVCITPTVQEARRYFLWSTVVCVLLMLPVALFSPMYIDGFVAVGWVTLISFSAFSALVHLVIWAAEAH